MIQHFSRHDMNLSNSITLCRLFCLFPIIYFYNHNQYAITLVFLIIGMITDFLDGFIARKTNTITEFGKIFDPLIDKICLGTLALLLLLNNAVPLWIVTLLLLRDILILCGGIYLAKKKNIILTSLPLGKLAVTLIALGFSFALFQTTPEIKSISEFIFYISALFLVASLIQYSVRFIATLNS